MLHEFSPLWSVKKSKNPRNYFASEARENKVLFIDFKLVCCHLWMTLVSTNWPFKVAHAWPQSNKNPLVGSNSTVNSFSLLLTSNLLVTFCWLTKNSIITSINWLQTDLLPFVDWWNCLLLLPVLNFKLTCYHLLINYKLTCCLLLM